jgi:hypothetical protein
MKLKRTSRKQYTNKFQSNKGLGIVHSPISQSEEMAKLAKDLIVVELHYVLALG